MTDFQKQTKTWLTPEQDRTDPRCLPLRVVCTLPAGSPQTLIADTGLRVGELVALDWAYLNLNTEPDEPYPQSEIQKGNPGASYLALAAETRRQFRRYQKCVWKDSEALFPSRQSDRMADRSVRNVITRVAEEAGVRPSRIEGERGDSHEVSPHTFRHSIAFRLIRRENKRLEDVMLWLRHANL